MLAYRDGARVRLISRNGVDHTRRFRELAAAIAKPRSTWCSTALGCRMKGCFVPDK